MSKISRPLFVLNREQILDGYRLCLQNVHQLQEAAGLLMEPARSVSLAVAQIGQEELGKSMLLLNAVTFADHDDWREFWRRWRNHDAKANMAALYEWLHPFFFVWRDKQGREFDGIGARAKYSDEKEAGLYVDFDQDFNAFVLPAWRVPAVEARGRSHRSNCHHVVAWPTCDVNS